MRVRKSSNTAVAGLFIAAIALPFAVGQLAAGLSEARPAAASGLAETSVSAPANADQWAALDPLAPDQANIARFVTEGFESERVFDRGSAWRTFDALVTQPGLNDQIRWGRRDCERTVGEWGAWAVGGGTTGAGWTCGADYPSPLDVRPSMGLRTELQYLYLNFANVPSEGGLRITFDYKAKMPANALFVGAGDFDRPNPDGSIPIRGRNDMTPNTAGEWVRGHRVEIRDDPTTGFVITGKARVILAFVYSDPQPAGRGVPGSGFNGVFLDNVHLDAMFVTNPGVIPSPPTPTPPDTPEPTKTVTPTATDFAIPITPTRGPENAIRLPYAANQHLAGVQDPVPTAPSATTTPIPTPSDTPLPSATFTVAPTITPTPTPVPSFTPVSVPDVVFSLILPLDDPEIARVINQGTAPQDMTGWRVFELRNTRNCYFPDGLILGPNETFEFQTGRGSRPGDNIAVCDAQRLIWDNNWDEGQLWNNRGERIDRWCYDRFGPLPCD